MCSSKHGKNYNDLIKGLWDQMSYVMIIFNDGRNALRSKFWGILKECGEFVGFEGNPLMWLMFE